MQPRGDELVNLPSKPPDQLDQTLLGRHTLLYQEGKAAVDWISRFSYQGLKNAFKIGPYLARNVLSLSKLP